MVNGRFVFYPFSTFSSPLSYASQDIWKIANYVSLLHVETTRVYTSLLIVNTICCMPYVSMRPAVKITHTHTQTHLTWHQLTTCQFSDIYINEEITSVSIYQIFTIHHFDHNTTTSMNDKFANLMLYLQQKKRYRDGSATTIAIE